MLLSYFFRVVLWDFLAKKKLFGNYSEIVKYKESGAEERPIPFSAKATA
jgi:hypothetical protein